MIKFIHQQKNINKNKKLTDTKRKIQISFYYEICRMKDSNLTKQIFDFLLSKKAKNKWFAELQEEITESKINQKKTIRERANLEKILRYLNKMFQYLQIIIHGHKLTATKPNSSLTTCKTPSIRMMM